VKTKVLYKLLRSWFMLLNMKCPQSYAFLFQIVPVPVEPHPALSSVAEETAVTTFFCTVITAWYRSQYPRNQQFTTFYDVFSTYSVFSGSLFYLLLRFWWFALSRSSSRSWLHPALPFRSESLLRYVKVGTNTWRLLYASC